MNNSLNCNSYKRIFFPKRKYPNPIVIFFSNQGDNIGKSAVIKLLESASIKKIDQSHINIFKYDSGQPGVQFKDEALNEKVYISFSHKDDYHVVAAGLKPLGIDIEKKREFYPTIIRAIFTERESQNIKHIFKFINDKEAEKDMNLAYTCLFSLKESVSKAIGRGLGINFKKILINLTENSIKIHVLNDMSIFQGYLTLMKDKIISLIEKIN